MFILEIRRLKPHEFEQAINLSDEIFRDSDHESMGKSFPQVFSKELQQSFGAFVDEKLVSFIGLVPSNIQVNDAILNVFSIGSVCTHENYRQQGISSAILKEVYKYIDDAQASLLFVSGDRGLYTRNHCYHFGTAYKYIIDEIEEVSYEGSIRKGVANDLFQVHNIVRGKNVRFMNTVWEWSKQFKSAGYTSIFKMDQQLYVAENNDGKIEAYVVVALPTPISTKENAMIIEWGGEPKVIKKIIHELLTKNIASNVELIGMEHESIHQEFNIFPHEKMNNGGTVHIVNTHRLIKQIMPYLMTIDSNINNKINITTKDDVITFDYEDSTINLTKKELVNFLFTEQQLNDQSEFGKIFPIPLPHTNGLQYV